MANLISAALLCFLVVVVAGSFAAAQETALSSTAVKVSPTGSVWYQEVFNQPKIRVEEIHSWNDGNEWAAAFKKGITYWKMYATPSKAPRRSLTFHRPLATPPNSDFYWMPQSFCQLQQRVNTDSRGCFVLNHDTPVGSQMYNTSSDVLNFVSKPSNQRYFTTSERIYISLCFKAPPSSVCNSTQGSGWVSLIDDFYNQATSLVASRALNLEFILDGGATPTSGDCLIEKWRPWVSTWITNPLMAFFGNSGKGFDRFQVYDEFANSYVIKSQAVLNFGKFSSGNYPLLVWEPSDEADLCLFVSIYEGWLTNTPNARVPPYVFAINIDPIQFQIYISGCTNQSNLGLHQLFSTSTAPTEITSFTSVGSGIKPTSGSFLVTQGAPASGGQATFQISVLGSTNQRFIQSNHQSTQPLPVGDASIFSSIQLDHRYLLLSNTNGGYNLYSIASDLSMRLEASGAVHNPFSLAGATAQLFASYHFIESTATQNTQPFLAEVYANASSAFLSLKIWKFSLTPNNTLSVVSAVMGADVPVKASQVQKVSVALVQQPNANGCLIEGLVSFSLTNGKTHIAYVCGMGSNLQILSGEVDVGTNSHVSVAVINNWLSGLEVHGDGYCWNTEVRNKRATPLVCESSPVSTPNILNYNYGSMLEWRKFLSTPKLVSSCETTIVHGTYDQGYSPAATLINNPSGTATKVYAVHQGLKTADKDPSQCGRPQTLTPSGGTVLDSWYFSR